MIRQRSKLETASVFNNSSSKRVSEIIRSRFSIADVIKFVFYCVLLIVPVYAIAKSAIKQDWLMMVIDALLVPVGFVHGLLLMFGLVT